MTAAAAASKRLMKTLKTDVGAFPHYPQPDYVPSQKAVESTTIAMAPPTRTNGRTFLGFAVALLVAGGAWWYWSGSVSVAPSRQVAVFEWDGVEYLGVGRDFSQVVRGMGPCVKVEQWLQPIDNPETGKTVTILKGVCVEMGKDNDSTEQK